MFKPTVTRPSQNFNEKYVADILSSMANGDPAVTTQPYSTSPYITGISTGTTPTLTPTTLNAIEQTFIELQSVNGETNMQIHDPMTQSGFVPPLIDSAGQSAMSDNGSDVYYSDESLSDSDWTAMEVKRARLMNGGASVMSDAAFDMLNAAPQRKPRRNRNDKNISPEEAERRRVRRERNKVAAAKCRQRRVDHTNRLINETEKLHDDRASLENEIQNLKQQKDQLEFILQAHKPLCTASGLAHHMSHTAPAMAHSTPVMAHSNIPMSLTTHIKTEPAHSMTNIAQLPLTVVKSEPMGFSSSTCGLRAIESATARPNSLILPHIPVTSSAPVSITTPSNGYFMFGLDSIMGGSSGLTPITGIPSCSSQAQQRSNHSDSSPDGIGSPTLISL